MNMIGTVKPLGDKIEEYDRLNLLGRGAFAEVYRARCRITKMYVAIKMIDKQLMQTNRMTDRVKQEANIHLQLSHPAILQLYRFFEDADYIYLILELAEYGDIQNYLSTNNIQLTETETAVIMKQIVDGLIYLHSLKIVHRDMKLPNLLVTGDLKVKIADFGLATQLKTATEKHMTMCGTPNYIAPEVASRTSHGLPADVWGLGIMMYTLLVGRPPFDTDAVASTLKKVITSELMIPIHMSPEAKDLLARLLQKDQTQRIRLDAVMRHPFMTKHNQTIASTDSGLMTMSSSTSPSVITPRSIPLQRTRSADPYRYQLLEEPIVEATESPGIVNIESGYGGDNYGRATDYALALRRNGSLEVGKCGSMPPENSLYHGFGSSSGYRQHTHFSDNVLHHHNRPTDPGGGGYFQSIQSPMRPNQENVMDNQQYLNVNPMIFPNALPCEEPKVDKINVAPINGERLQPTRYKTKKAILTIDVMGNIIVELIRFKAKYNADRVMDVCRISKNGQRIEVYQPDPGRGIEIMDSPPTFPVAATKCYDYNQLPSQHWKKYTYASRFVQLVRAKTPKVTYYSTQAKCLLMESLEDFEMIFYDGGEKFLRSPSNGIQFIDRYGSASSVSPTYSPESDVGPPAVLWQHYLHCLAHCTTLEKALRLLPVDGDVFPNIAGRRPATYDTGSVREHNANKVIITPSHTPNMQSFTHSVTSVSSSNQRPSSRPMSVNTSGRVLVPGIGIAVKSSQGMLEVLYNDDTQLSMLPEEQGGGFIFRSSVSKGGIPMRYTKNDELPELVRVRLEQIPVVLQHMAASEAAQTPVSTRRLNAMRFCR